VTFPDWWVSLGEALMESELQPRSFALTEAEREAIERARDCVRVVADLAEQRSRRRALRADMDTLADFLERTT